MIHENVGLINTHLRIHTSFFFPVKLCHTRWVHLSQDHYFIWLYFHTPTPPSASCPSPVSLSHTPSGPSSVSDVCKWVDLLSVFVSVLILGLESGGCALQTRCTLFVYIKKHLKAQCTQKQQFCCFLNIYMIALCEEQTNLGC